MNQEEREPSEHDLEADHPEYDDRSLPWHERLLWRWWPSLAMRLVARESGIVYERLALFDSLLRGVEHFDVVPCAPKKCGHRGFQLVLCNRLTLFFYQEGRHFVYDGYEIGEYEPGDITVFDHLPDPSPAPDAPPASHS